MFHRPSFTPFKNVRLTLPASPEVRLAYRHLYQHLLRAVQYSKPSRFAARDRLRATFRNNPAGHFDPARVARTLEFLDGAAKARGLEHKIVKNLMFVWWEEKQARNAWVQKERLGFRKVAYDDFNRTIKLLEESMGMTLG